MSVTSLYPGERALSPALVADLLQTQFPEWADLPIKALALSGTDHAMFRLGRHLTVRLPRMPRAALQVDKEHRWLPWLAPQLPLPIPTVIGKGQPSESFPHSWSVYGWLEGLALEDVGVADRRSLTHKLGAFVVALRDLDAAEGPPSGWHNFGRGVPLAERDEATRAALAALTDILDATPLLRAWDQALAAPAWTDPPAWLHGDLQAGNLLVRDGQLSAVIDFGGLGVGDPACDLAVAWNTLAPGDRPVFRRVVDADEATWARGKGWALSIAAIALPYYLRTNPSIAAASRQTLNAVLGDPT